MSADLLRQAADRLDALADHACGGPWRTRDDVTIVGNGTKVATVHVASGHTASAAYIAAMSPTMGKALATWLREAAMRREVGSDYSDHALAVARAVLGDDQ